MTARVMLRCDGIREHCKYLMSVTFRRQNEQSALRVNLTPEERESQYARDQRLLEQMKCREPALGEEKAEQ